MVDQSMLTITYALNNALAIVALHREPVNSMNTALWTACQEYLAFHNSRGSFQLYSPRLSIRDRHSRSSSVQLNSLVTPRLSLM